MKLTTFKSSRLLALSAMTLALTLAGCGGGGGGAALDVPTLLSTTNIQGMWTGTLGSDAAAAEVFPDGKVWLYANSSPLQLYTGVYQGSSSNYTATANQYTSGITSLISSPVAFDFATTTSITKSALVGTMTSKGGLPSAYTFTYDNRYETAAASSDMAFSWTGKKSDGALIVNWTVNPQGVLSGYTTNGACQYTGTVLPHMVNTVAVGVFDLTLSEACTDASGTKTNVFAGIVKLNSDKTEAVFAFANSAGTLGDVQFMSKAL